MNNFFSKINNRYNIQNPYIPVSSEHESKSKIGINTLSPKIATFVNKIENHQQTFNKAFVVESPASYQEKINKIVTNWQQLQKEKKIYQQQQQCVTEKEPDEFDRIMEEDLENQLKELEQEEEKQYKLIEQVIEEQLGQEYQNNPTDYFEEDHLKQFEELETLLEEEQEQEKQNNLQFKKNTTWKHHEQHYHLEQFQKYQQQSNKKQLDKINKLFQQKQQNITNLDLWKQKHDIYLKQIMNKANQMKMNKIIHLLEEYYRTKRYYIQLSK